MESGQMLLSIFYGVVQGLTEFLPVSSSGHLAILQSLFELEGFDDSLLFTVLLHLGTLAAVFILYRKDIAELLAGFFSLLGKIFSGNAKYKSLAANEKFAALILIATCPLMIAAFLDKKIEALSAYPKLVGAFLLVNALILFLSDKIINGSRTAKNSTPRNALIVGVAQIIAVLPGISRSGATITCGLVNGFSRQFAVKFSFILSIPAILGASAFKIAEFAQNGGEVSGSMIASATAGLAAAFISGLFAIVLLRMVAKKKNFYIFSIYCTIIGVIALVFG